MTSPPVDTRHGGARGAVIRRRTLRQQAVVVGYRSGPGASLMLFLACGLLPSLSLLYAGRARVRLATPQDARDLMTALRQLKLPRHVPVLRTPLPTDITCVVPEVIVNVNHAGWTKGGLMREGQVVKWWRFSEAPADLPPATAHGPPGHSPVKKHR